MVKTFIAVILCLGFAAPLHLLAAASPAKSAAPQAKPAKPDWSELTVAQRNVLMPLMDDWKELDTVRRAKWVKVADQFPKMKPEQQQRLQTRMRDWAKLAPEQRRIVREKFLNMKKLPPAKREHVTAQWQQYQQSLAARSSDQDIPDSAAAPSTSPQ